MALELRFARRAQIDLDMIYQHGAQAFGLPQADRYAVDMMACLDGLCDFPFTGTQVEAEQPDLRRRPCGAHVIFYLVTASSVEVVRILHQRMDPARHL